VGIALTRKANVKQSFEKPQKEKCESDSSLLTGLKQTKLHCVVSQEGGSIGYIVSILIQ